MSEISYYLRLNSPGAKELKTYAIDVFGDPAEVTSQLASGYSRKGMCFYNNSNTASGEILWGGSDLSESNGMVIPKGAAVDIPLSTDVPVYVMNTISGEIGNLRVVEIA